MVRLADLCITRWFQGRSAKRPSSQNGVSVFNRCLYQFTTAADNRIEVAVRTAILQELNTHFGTHWYLDFTKVVFKNASDQAKWFGEVAREVQRSEKQKFIAHYHAKYTNPRLPPSWAVAECLSFGKWSTLYKELAHGKSAIANMFGLSAPVSLSEFLCGTGS